MRLLLLIPIILLCGGCENTYYTPQEGPAFQTDLGIRETVWGSLQTYESLRTITTTPPILPRARIGNISGEGITKGVLLIAQDGTVSEAKLQQSCGSKDLDKAALIAFKKWTFPPLESEIQRVSINAISFNINTGPAPVFAPIRISDTGQ